MTFYRCSTTTQLKWSEIAGCRNDDVRSRIKFPLLFRSRTNSLSSFRQCFLLASFGPVGVRLYLCVLLRSFNAQVGLAKNRIKIVLQFQRTWADSLFTVLTEFALENYRFLFFTERTIFVWRKLRRIKTFALFGQYLCWLCFSLRMYVYEWMLEFLVYSKTMTGWSELVRRCTRTILAMLKCQNA